MTTLADAAMPLVTIEEAKLYCRIGSEGVDDEIEIMIDAASATVRDYAAGWDGMEPVPARLKLAALALVAAHYDGRHETSDVHLERILGPYRTLKV